MIPEQEKLLNEIFYPHIIRERQRISSKPVSFSHYTDATAALSIIRNKSIWMRQACEMNDFSEIKYGLQKVEDFFFNQSENHPSKRFWACIDTVLRRNIDASERFSLIFENLQKDTYLTCVTEHNIDRDQHGRLSMWRGYGRGNGVAFVFNSNPILNHSQAMLTASIPALYYSDNQTHDCFQTIVENLERNASKIHGIDENSFLNRLFLSFLSFALGLKHPAFDDEREWRITLNPKLFSITKLSSQQEIISGVPQSVYKIPLENRDSDDYFASLDDLLELVIIGPSANASELKRALALALEEAGVVDAEQKVVVSNIPLRN